MRSAIWNRRFLIAVLALPLIAARTYMAEAASKRTSAASETVQQVIAKKAGSVQLVTFPETGWNPVRVVRGSASAKSNDVPKPETEKAETAELLTFGDSLQSSVRVVRGETSRTVMVPGRRRESAGMNLEMVSFTDPRDQPVSILRGSPPHFTDFELFGPASVAELDRFAFAVDGAESSHGADLRMWRAEPTGPQGPMQVTAAAASDVGGGDRFDLAENRVLGRAYLARMFRRYGSWPDAIAAYNWGPGNLDAWITGGRAADSFPLEVERYRDRVLRDATLAQTGALMMTGGQPIPAAASGTPSSNASRQ